uniref:Proline and serine rich 2 n=1 Tax=Anas platyrhynchos TaxID=8839 RepID=A0A8B9SFQ6_ANAPL
RADDESMKYLTHEEQDVLMFFEETIDALEDDLEEPVLHDSGIHCQSSRSTEENVSSHSETEDIIDLVQSTPESSDHEGPPSKDAEPEESPKPAAPADRSLTSPLPPPPPPAVQHPKLLRSIPTPLIMAQKMKKTPVANGDCFAAPKHPPAPAPKLHRFPSNINITNVSGKEFNETISKAAVNVQERRAQVLANINGGAFLAAELEEKLTKWIMPRALSSLDAQPKQADTVPNGYQNIHEVLKSEPSPFHSLGKTVTIKPEGALAANKAAQQNAAKGFNDYKPPNLSLDMRRRSGSLPRPSGFRSQGITVKFAGRGSTEEARREALRKLGLLKETA